MPHPHGDHDIETPTRDVAAGVRQPPAPGEEVAGPPLSDLVIPLRQVAAGLEALYRQARVEAHRRYATVRQALQTDSNGDGAVELFNVPQGATAYLCWLIAELDGTTPATPMTAATLWHGIFSGDGGARTFAQLAGQPGNLLAFQPASVAADAQLPAHYNFGEPEASPTLVGPQSFYFGVDATTAARQLVVRCGILIEQPEP